FAAAPAPSATPSATAFFFFVFARFRGDRADVRDVPAHDVAVGQSHGRRLADVGEFLLVGLHRELHDLLGRGRAERELGLGGGFVRSRRRVFFFLFFGPRGVRRRRFFRGRFFGHWFFGRRFLGGWVVA